MNTKEPRKTHDDERTEKMIPLITAETAFRQRVCELVFLGSTYLTWFTFWTKLVLLPLIIIFITASLSSKVQCKAPK